MAQSPKSFAKRLRRFANDIPRLQNEIKKEIIREVATEVVGRTPVLTGQARSNYFFTIGRPDNTSLMAGPFGGGRFGSGDMSLGRAFAAISRVKPGEPVYMTNNLPYIGRLNDGYSAQAPARFIQTATESGIALIQRQVVRFSRY